MGRVPERALRWGLERVTPERDLCGVLEEAGWLEPSLVSGIRAAAIQTHASTKAERPDTEPLGLEELPPQGPPPVFVAEPDESAWPTDGGASEEAEAETGVGALGPYRVIRKLGQGGMGVVFLAEHVVLRREVAVKVIRLRPGADLERALRRFEIEARAMARLEHENILKVLDIRVEGERAYMVMALARGGSLADRIQTTLASPPGESNALPIREVVGWIEGVARALHHAHTHSIVHRDVKPDNILFDSEGRPLLTDFGLAKALDEDNAGLSTPGAMIGTLLYMAPEQIVGRQIVDARADVYALGVTFYETLTGSPPFLAVTHQELIDHVLTRRAPSPRRRRPAVPKDVETMVARSLAKDREDRYQTALALAEDCRRFLEQRPILARPVSVPERVRLWVRRNPLLAIGLVVALVFLAVTPFLYDLAQQRDQTREALKMAEAVKAVNEQLERERAKALKAEVAAVAARRRAQSSLARGTYLQATLEAQAGRRQRASALFGQAADQLRALGASPFPAEVGRWNLWRRAPQALLPFPGPDTVSLFAIRGDRVWLSRGGTLEVWDATRAVLLERLTIPEGTLSEITLSSDGRSAIGGGSRGIVWHWTLGASVPRVLAECGTGINALAWRNNGDFALSADSNRVVRLHDVAKGKHLLIPMARKVHALCFVPNTTRFLVGFRDEVEIWEGEGAIRLGSLPVPGRHLAGYSKLALAGAPGVVHLIDPLSNRIVHRFEIDSRPLRALAFGRAGGLVVDAHGVLHRLNTLDRRVSQRWELVGDRLSLAAFDAQTERVLALEPTDTTPGAERRFPSPRLWRLAEGRHQRTWRAPIRPRTTLCRAANGLVVSGCADGLIEVWDPNLELRVASWRQRAPVTALAASGERIVSGGMDGLVRVWEFGERRPLFTLGPHAGPIRALAFSPGGQRLLVGGEGMPRRALDLPADDPARSVLEGYPIGAQERVTLHPDGRLRIEGSSPARLKAVPIRLWDLSSRTAIGSWSTGRVTALDWSAETPVSGGQAGRLQAWDLATGTPSWQTATPASFEGIVPAGMAVLRTASGWILAAGPVPWVVPLEGGPARRLGLGEGLAEAIALAAGASENFVWSGHSDGKLVLWNTASGERLTVIEAHDGPLWALLALPEGRLLSAGEDGRIRLWDFTQDEVRVEVERELAVEVTRRSRGGGAAPWPSVLVRQLASASGAWDLAEEEIQRDGSPLDRQALARARRIWPALEALLVRAPGVRGRLQSVAFADATTRDQAVEAAAQLLARGHADREEFNAIVKRLRKLASTPLADERLHLYLGSMAESTGRTQEAAASYREALTINPDLAPRTVTPGFLQARGNFYLEQKRNAAALVDFRRLGESEHRLAGAPSRIYAHLLLAANEPARALAALGQDEEPADRRLRSRILLQLGRTKEALAALDTEDKHVRTVLARARVLRAVDRLSDAERLLRAIIELNPTIDVGLKFPVAFRYYERDLERYERKPKFVESYAAFGDDELGARDLFVRYRITARESLQIVDREYAKRQERRPDLVVLEARVELARVLCRASRKQPKDRTKLKRLAVEQLRLAIDGGLRDFQVFDTDPDLSTLRRGKDYQALLKQMR